VFAGIRQQITYQGRDEIPLLYAPSQLLLSITPNEAMYATTQTEKKFWAIWREEEAHEGELENILSGLVNAGIPAADWDKMLATQKYGNLIRKHFGEMGPRMPTEQDRAIYSMLRPGRLLELIYQFIVYDNGIKKIARYQQYFAIKATINRVAHLNTQGSRTGGVIWHTTGSGKSLTMVMLAKALALHPNIQNPRIILVTDRVNLDNQIFKTFTHCGKSVAKAKDGKHLVRMVTGKLKKGDERVDVITTIINKFEEAARQKTRDENVNIFVLVDESHRSQYGSLNAKMQKVFPNACFIGFTGTPLTKKEKSTAEKFGAFIHKYPIRTAVADGAVVPLLYEGRIVEQDVDKEQLDRWFERTTRFLEKEQVADLKRKMSRSDAVNATDQRVKEIAYNISEHYKSQWRKTGFKGQLATASKAMGLKYLKYLTMWGIDCALAISPPDMREGGSEVDSDEAPAVQTFWKKMMEQHRTETEYNKALLNDFKDPEKTEILIVVDKLLTGFDEPRNTILYIDKPLKEHTLLQAIARVNRLFEGKEFGYIIDYRGVLGQLNDALSLYDALAEYDIEDIDGTLTDISEEIDKLAQLHSDLWAIFAPVKNQNDIEEMGQFLGPEDVRQRFYESLTAYASTLKMALGVVRFYELTAEARIEQYKNDLKFFDRLRRAVRLRYAETVDYRDYEDKVRKLLDEHVKATGTTQITQEVNIFDVEKFDEEVARLQTPAAKADTILSHMKRTITEKMEEDPAFYRKFADLVEETILAYREGRIDELEMLRIAETGMGQMRSGAPESGDPSKLDRYQHAPAYYRSLKEPLLEYNINPDDIADIAIRQEEILEANKVTDWANNLDIQNRIKRDLDEVFYELERKTGTQIELDQVDQLIEGIIEMAKARDRSK
jgi:type I restriction enzyme R subunit